MDKIQPKQIQLHAFSSPSGHLNITQNDTTVTVNLQPTLTGNFNLKGNVTRSGEFLHSASTSNTALGVRGYVLGGQNNYLSGANCIVVNSRYSYISGTSNLDLNGDYNYIHSGAIGNTILAGQNVSIGDYDGSTCMKDGKSATSLASRGDNTLNIKYDGGIYLDGNVYISDTLFVNNSSSGHISGDMNVDGLLLWNGSGLSLFHDMTGYALGASGALNTKIQQTGLSLINYFNSATGIVRTFGDQNITGFKTFFNGIKFSTGQSKISETGNNPNTIDLNVTDGNASTGNSIEIKSKDSVTILLDSNNDGSYARANFTGASNSSFIVGIQNTTPNYANQLFVVNPSGVGYFSDTVILASPTTVPSASASAGITGQISWDSSYFYLYRDNSNGWGRIAWSSW